MSYLLLLHEDGLGNPPDAEDAELYATELELTVPVLADPTNQIVQQTPWDGFARPGKCVVTPDMEILYCYVGEGDEEGFAAIEAHAGG